MQQARLRKTNTTKRTGKTFLSASKVVFTPFESRKRKNQSAKQPHADVTYASDEEVMFYAEKSLKRYYTVYKKLAE